MDRRALLAVAISIAILLVYQKFVLERFYPPTAHTPVSATPPALAPQGQAPAEPIPPPPPPPEGAPETHPRPAAISNAPTVTVDTDLYTAVITAAGGRLQSLTLKKYRTSNAPGSPPLELILPGDQGELPMGLELRSSAKSITDDDALYEIKGGPLQLSGDQEGTLTMTWRAEGLEIEKRVTFAGGRYPIGVEVAPTQLPAGTQEIALSWEKGVNPEGVKGRVFQGAVALVDNKLQHRAFKDLDKGELLSGNIAWAGYGDTYFLSAVIPENGDNYRLWFKLNGHTAEARVLARAVAGQSIRFQLFVGPKDFDVLESTNHGLVRAIDFGYFAFIAVPLLRVLRLSHAVTGNYGIDIILLTLGIKILFIPLTQKSFKSMREMQKLQPQMAKIRERLKDKPEEMNREIMELYRRHKVNPLGGCLPMALQIPVFIGLYNTLLNAIELRHAPFAFWITDLSQPDRLGAMAIPYVDPPGIPVLTLVMGASMLGQQLMTPTTGDPAQQRMMMIMPLVFTFMFINFPAGLVLYWLVNNLLTIAQQYVMSRRSK